MRRINFAYMCIVRLVICAVILAGAVWIGRIQWHEAASKTGLGTSDYGQGIVGTMLLTFVIGGMPIILWAFVSYVGLSWLLLGRVERHDAGQDIITSLPATVDPPRPPVPLDNVIV